MVYLLTHAYPPSRRVTTGLFIFKHFGVPKSVYAVKRMKNATLWMFLLVSGLFSNSHAGSLLVSTDWVEKHLHDADVVLVDLSDNLQYTRFHLPEAINLPYEYLNQTQGKINQSIGPTNIAKLLGQLGIQHDSTIILYDDTGGLNAARLFWELEQLGHRKVAILNGGLVKWIRERREVSAKAHLRKPTQYLPAKTDTSVSASLVEVKQASAERKSVLLDVRSEEEYLGDKEYKRSGHIPGAVSWPWDTALNTDEGFTLQSPAALKETLAKAGVSDLQQPIITYCQSGHRAAHAYLTLRELGFAHVKVYDGSMQEYARQIDLPLVLGKQPCSASAKC